MDINIVLVEPEIPQNTGNIVRSCGGVGANLHLVKPLGFSVEDKYLKRAGLDYWDKVTIKYYDSFDEVLQNATLDGKPHNFYYCSTKGVKLYSEIKYQDGDYLVFGKETKGLPEKLLHDNYDRCIRIPMKPDFRSLNLSNAVAIIMFEAAKQMNFKDMETEGALTQY